MACSCIGPQYYAAGDASQLAVVPAKPQHKLTFCHACPSQCHYEYDMFLKNYCEKSETILSTTINVDKVKGGREASNTDLRFLRAQESLREAYCMAFNPNRGFKGIGRPPELQQLIAATCMSMYSSNLVFHDPQPIHSALMDELCPHLRVTLLAEVASGILCPRLVPCLDYPIRYIVASLEVSSPQRVGTVGAQKSANHLRLGCPIAHK